MKSPYRISKDEIKRIANFARIEIQAEEEDELATQINRVVDLIDGLREVDTTGVEPIVNLTRQLADQTLRMEEDVAGRNDGATDLLRSQAHAKYGYFTVPKVIE